MKEYNKTILMSKVVNGKWLINAGDFTNLIKNIHRAQDQNIITKLVKGLASNLINKDKPAKAFDDDGDADDIGVNNNEPSIAIIPVSGILVKGASAEDCEEYGLCNTDFISSMLDEAAEDPNVIEIVLYINSPGGECTGIPELGRKISEIDMLKPVYTWCETQCNSAAYWLASQARIIGMTPSAEIGNVGVFLTIEDCTEALKKQGIHIEAISAGKYKLMGHGFHTLTDDEKAILNADIQETNDEFVNTILSKRTIAREDIEGLSYKGSKAINNGYADINDESMEDFLTTLTNNIET